MKNILLHRVLPLIIVLAMMLIGGTYLSVFDGETAPDGTVMQAKPTQNPEKPQKPAQEVKPDEQAPEETETPAAEPERFLLSFLGDCTLASVPAYASSPIGYAGVVGDNYGYPFEKTVQYFENDDFTFANLECALTNSMNPKAGKTFVLKADPSYAKIMSAGSVECVTLANNHIEDYLDQGIRDTEAALDAEGIAHVGRKDKGMENCIVYETDRGLKIGIFASSFGTLDEIKEGIARLKGMDTDFIIAAIHHGDEGAYDPTNEQIQQAHTAVDAGADFVYMSHPHTLQPREQYNGVWIYYSMGNFSFGGNTDPRDKDAFFLQLTLEKDAEGNVTIVDRVEIPCACSGTEDGNNYQPVVADPGSERYERVMQKLSGTFEGQKLSISYSYGNNE